jgi:hypothetical protein
MIEGNLPGKVRSLIIEWAELHQNIMPWLF